MSRNTIAAALTLILIVATCWFLIPSDERDDLSTIDVVTSGNMSRVNAERSVDSPVAKNTLKNPTSTLSQETKFASIEGLTENNSILVEVKLTNGTESVKEGTLTVVSLEEIQENMEAQDAHREDILGLASKFGAHYQIPKNGMLRIPHLQTPSLLAARTPTHFGQARGRLFGKGPIKLSLQPLTRIRGRIKNIDAMAVPGVTMEIGVCFPKRNARETIFAPKTSATVQKDGIATLNLNKAVLGSTGKSAKLYLSAEGVFDLKPYALLDQESLPADPVAINIGDTASAIIHVSGPDGKPFLGPCRLAIGVFNPSTDIERVGPLYQVHDSMQTVIHDGKVRLPLVQCDLKLLLVVRPPIGSVLKDIFRPILGPTAPGEIWEVTLQFTDEAPILSGRLIDTDGSPLGSQTIHTQIESKYPSRIVQNPGIARTDSAGFFRIPLRMRLRKGAVKRSIDLRISKTRSRKARSVSRSLPISAGPMVSTDLGDVRFKKEPILISGMIRDEDGEPVPFAKLDVSPIRVLGRRGVPFGSKSVVRKSNSKGNFLIYGVGVGERLAIFVNAPGFLLKTVHARCGERSVLIVLSRAGKMRARLILPETMSCDDLRIKFGKQGEYSWERLQREAGAPLLIKHLRTGTYQLEISLKDSPNTILRLIPSIQIVAGEETNLGDIHIQEVGGQVTFVLVNPSSWRKLEEATIFILRGGTRERIGHLSLRQNKRATRVPEFPCDALVTARGYRDLLIPNVRPGRTEIRLSRGIPVSIRFTNADIVPEDMEIKTHLHPKGDGVIKAMTSPTQTEKNGVTRVPRSGAYYVSVMIGGKTKNGEVRFHNIHMDKRATVEVLELDSLQTFYFKIDADSVKSAIKKFKR